MLHLGMNMPFVYMAFYGTIMIAIVILLRVLLENRMPKFVFPVLWGVVLLRLLVPFSLSSPFSLPVPENPFLSIRFLEQQLTREAEAAVLSEDRAVLAGAAENTGSVETSEVRDIDAVKEDVGTVSSSEQDRKSVV